MISFFYSFIDNNYETQLLFHLQEATSILNEQI